MLVPSCKQFECYSLDVVDRVYLELGRYEDPHYRVEDISPYDQMNVQVLVHHIHVAGT